jgi:hypothetical protein
MKMSDIEGLPFAIGTTNAQVNYDSGGATSRNSVIAAESRGFLFERTGTYHLSMRIYGKHPHPPDLR